MSDRPATEPRPFYDGPVCSRCGHEPHDDRPDPRCGEIVGGWDQSMPTPDYCGCADVDALWTRLIRAEAAQGAAPLDFGDLSAAPAYSEGAAPRAEGLDVERLAAALTQDFGPSYFPGLHDVTVFGRTPLEVAQKIADRYSRPSDERVPESEERCNRFRHDEHCGH